MTQPLPRLELWKALADSTRYAIYAELAASPRPLATADLAERLGLHVNTVRPHLERLRDVGLLDVAIEVRTGVGRPQNLYAPAAAAPSLGLEPPPFPLLARLLLRLAAATGVTGEEAAEIGRDQGRLDAAARTDAASCLEALVAQLDAIGFDPVVSGGDDDSGDTAVVAFAHCPFRELAEAHPELVCSLHRGMVEGLVDTFGSDEVQDFHSLVHRAPCQFTLVSR